MDRSLGIEEPGVSPFEEDRRAPDPVGQVIDEDGGLRRGQLVVVGKHPQLNPDSIESIEVW